MKNHEIRIPKRHTYSSPFMISPTFLTKVLRTQLLFFSMKIVTPYQKLLTYKLVGTGFTNTQ